MTSPFNKGVFNMDKKKLKDLAITVIEGIALFLFFCLDWEMIFGLK